LYIPISDVVSCSDYRRSDAGVLRHVRIVHRGGLSSGMISPSKAITPPEIPVLNKGMASSVFIGLTFATATDRDGITVAKFDVKSDRGMTSIEVRPTLGELLNDEAPRDMSQSDFDTKISGLLGIQRTSSPFTFAPMKADDFDSLPRKVLQHMNLVSETAALLMTIVEVVYSIVLHYVSETYWKVDWKRILCRHFAIQWAGGICHFDM